MPFITVNGLPLLRFDLNEWNIYVAGTAISPAHIFLLFILFLSFLFFFIYLTQLLGRIWCGWLCPQTIWLEFAGDLEIKKRRIPRILKILWNTILKALIAVIFTSGLAMYTMAPKTFIQSLVWGQLPYGWYIVALIIFLNLLLVGRIFCKTVCPYSMLQSVMADEDTLRIEIKPEKEAACIDCKACQRACPTGIDIREGQNSKCIACASCIDACGKVMAKRGGSLVTYFFGVNGFRPFRANRLISLSVALTMLILGAVLLYNTTELKASLHPGSIATNTGYTFEVSIKNRTKSTMPVTVESQSNGYTVDISPATLRLGAGDTATVTVNIALRENMAEDVLLQIKYFHNKKESVKNLHIKIK